MTRDCAAGSRPERGIACPSPALSSTTAPSVARHGPQLPSLPRARWSPDKHSELARVRASADHGT